MLPKLEKYAAYIKLSPKEKRAFISSAKPEEQFRASIPGASQSFSQTDFVHISVLDARREENMYKLKTFREKSLTGKPKAIATLFHGLKSHTNRGAHIAKYFANKGIETVGMDFRGFGQSEGFRGYIENQEMIMSDSLKFVKLVKDMYPGTPLFGVGLSLGGAIAYHLSLKQKNLFDGTVLMAPALMPSYLHASHFQKVKLLVELLQWILPNHLQILPTIKLEDTCRNPNYAEDCLKDEYYYNNRHKLRTMACAMQVLSSSPETFPDYDTPFLVVQGGRDKVIDPQVAFDLYSQSKTSQKDKQILFYQNMMHDIWKEPEIGEINVKAAEWILQRVGRIKSK